MSLQKRIQKREVRRTHRVRNAQVSRGIKPRVTVFRSSKHIYAQIVDDAKHATIVGFSTLNLQDASGDKKTCAHRVGVELGKLALQKNVKEVFFDRGCFLYHGRIKSLAEGLREAGLVF